MNQNKIEFTSSSKAVLIPYLLDNSYDKPFILVIPGGGYDHYGKKEQDTICEFFNSKGFSSALLLYTLAPFKFPDALMDLAQCVAYIREKSNEWKIDEHKLILCGFSAGGHLSASLGCFWNSPLLKNISLNGKNLLPQDIRPDGLCLCYPVISSDKKICHEKSILRLTENLSEEECKFLCDKTETKGSLLPKELIRDALSLEKHVSKDFPKTFMWHTVQDKAVPAENTIEFAKALKEKNIDFEYHLFAEGEHGLSLAKGTSAESWTDLFISFSKKFD